MFSRDRLVIPCQIIFVLGTTSRLYYRARTKKFPFLFEYIIVKENPRACTCCRTGSLIDLGQSPRARLALTECYSIRCPSCSIHVGVSISTSDSPPPPPPPPPRRTHTHTHTHTAAFHSGSHIRNPNIASAALLLFSYCRFSDSHAMGETDVLLY